MADFDLAIIGGGINGTGIARDAAGRGFRVVLIEQSDLAAATSSASSKLIHGGLRYLEHYQFRLVRAAVREREVLLKAAPHLIRPLRFVLPINPARRSPTLIRLGLMLYDWIGWRKFLPGTREVDLVIDETGQPLKSRFHHAFEYSDCFADDARLVVLNAVDAAERGAVIRTRTRCIRAERGDEWRLVLNARGQRDVVTARILVNAAGASVETFAETALRQQPPHRLRLDKGSHIVVRRLFDHDRAYILQASDGRVVFAIPFQGDFTLIGTTDRAFAGDPSVVLPSGEEIDYLCNVANEYFRTEIGAADVVWAYAGVRALYDDGARKPQDIGRDYTLILDERFGEAPLLTVYGGKITTYRRLA
ncbi:MAG TPA: glycerol-3-phosphate dehydrogenase, partial [Xanthobacteraceae bacterium]